MENGFSAIFSTDLIVAVSGAGKSKRDTRYTRYSDSKRKQEKPFFSDILRKASDEPAQDLPAWKTTTYGADSKMRTYLYQSKEYHF